MKQLPKRIPNRLKNYDYSANGAYFITICVQDMKCVLSKITQHGEQSVGEGLCTLPQVQLTPIGEEVEKSIQYINVSYQYTKVVKYVVMPNHIHLLITIKKSSYEEGASSGGCGDPPLQEIIRRFKTYTTRQYGDHLWQRSYYDHISRNDYDFQSAWQYIDENPKKWLLGKDKYYT